MTNTNLKLINKPLYFIIFICCCVAGYFTLKYYKYYSSDYINEDIYSKVLDENRRIFVSLPEDYRQNRTYPLVIKSDGKLNMERWRQSFADIGKEAIIVAIPNLLWRDTRNRDLVPPYARRDVQIEPRPANQTDLSLFGRADKFLQFIELELIPYIEANYQVSDTRILSGFSAGGSMVLYTLSTKPALFDAYFAFSPAAWYDGAVVVDEFAKALPNIGDKPLYLYLSLGSLENDIIGGAFKGLLAALERNAPANLRWNYSYSEGADHGQNPYDSIPKALKGYYQHSLK